VFNRTVIFATAVFTAMVGCGREPDLAMSDNPYFQRGISYVPFDSEVLMHPDSDDSIQEMTETGADWVALVPIWYQDDKTSTEIGPDSELTPTDESVRRAIQYFHHYGVHVMLKPYVDSRDGTWRAEFEPVDWDAWFESYRAFIWHYAEIAGEENAELFSVGCEYKSSDGDPARYGDWAETINGVRERYNGELTYAADWSNYWTITFWPSVEYIGIDAYFPLSDSDKAGVDDLVAGWENELDRIDRWLLESGLVGKMVIFTEVGYRSTPGCWRRPGDVGGTEVDLKAQEDCYRALLTTAPARSWFQGLFIWWWDNPSTKDWGGGVDDPGYTPNGKPAGELLSDYYKKYEKTKGD
jgi:hypothetical protein